MLSRINPFLLGLLLPCIVVSGQDYENMVFDETRLLDNTVTLKWSIMGSEIIFKAEATTDGYIGIGFSKMGNMVDADLTLAGVRAGVPYLTDAYSSANGLPKVDDSQDVELLYGNEMNGKTTVIFKRSIVASNKQDKTIQNGKVFVIWALGSDFDNTLTNSQYHFSNKGATKIMFYKDQIVEEEEYDDGVSVDESNKQTPYSRFLDSQDKVMLKWGIHEKIIKFELTAETRGWMGLGFTDSHDMRNADIYLMGVNNNEPYIMDAFAPDNFLPSVDASQDVTLLGYYENGTHTTMKFERKLLSTHRHDKTIEDKKTYIIYANGLYDILSPRPNWMDYHYLWKGHVELNLLSRIKKEDELTTIPDNAPRRVLDSSGVVLRWITNEDKILFELTAPTNGWVGLGIARNAKDGMRNADIVMSGMKEGKKYVFDMLAERNTLPKIDETQNVELLRVEESGGKTTVYLRRKLVSPDLKFDHNIKEGDIHLIWAYGTRDIRGNEPNYVDYHRRNRGKAKIDLLKEVERATKNGYPYEEYLDGDEKVLLQWKYDDDDIEFRLSTPSTGWAGLGFSPGTNMVGADMAVMSYNKAMGGEIKDLHATQNSVPLTDKTNEYILQEANEENGRSTFIFRRPRAAMTPGEDRPIEEGDMNILYAFGEGDAFGTLSGTDYHFANKGSKKLTLIPQTTVDEDSQFRFSEYLDTQVDVLLQWNFNDIDLVFQVTAPTTGWIGIGFNSQQNMINANLILMTKDGNGKARAIDAYATANTAPSVDAEQGVEILGSSSNGTHTTYTARMSRVAQYVTDRSIVGPVQVLWAYGENNIVGDPKLSDIHIKKGAKLILLIRESAYDIIIGTEVLDETKGIVMQWASPFPNNLFIQFSAPTTGWLGFGLSRTKSMKEADMSMFGIKANGDRYLYDLHGGSMNGLPIEDTSDDVQLVVGLEHDGRTIAMLARNMTIKPTEIGSDLPVTNKKIYAIWAYGETDLDGPPTGADYHRANRGYKEVDIAPTLPDMIF